MSIKKGFVNVVDRYKGAQLVEQVRKGSDLIFDPYTEITGYLPMIFKSRATVALKNYRIYGTSAGAGVETESGEPAGYKLPLTVESGETENLFDIVQYLTKREASYVYVNGYYCFKKDASKFYYNKENISDYKNEYLLLENNIELTNVALFRIELLNEDSEIIKSTPSNTEHSILLIPENAKYLRLNWSGGGGEDIAIRVSITEFSPESYIPHRYTSDIPIYIGFSKLGEDEYLDFAEQKVYRYVDGVLTPVDPPLPLPTISTYKGENTLSSTETLGEVTVKGRIRELTYRRVEYLKSTGTQYIITDIVPTNTTKTVLDVEFGTWKLTTHGDSERGLIGADSLSSENKSTEVYRINLLGTVNSSDDRAFSFYAGYGWRDGIGCYLYNPAIPSRNILILQSNMGSWGSTSISLTEAKTLREPTLPMPIFGSARLYEATGSIVRSPFKVTNMSLYNCKIYDSENALSHNLVPVEREDGELGLLDTMTNKFYANAGTGTFEKGEYI